MSHYLSNNLINARMNASCCAIVVAKSPHDYQAFRISLGGTNKLAIVFDSATANTSLTVCVEIFDIGGKTPPDQHQRAVEMFLILQGEGKAICNGNVAIKAGNSLLVPPMRTHVIENTGTTRLYALCIMVPNEDFTELIRSGTPVDLDEEDIAVLCRNSHVLTPA